MRGEFETKKPHIISSLEKSLVFKGDETDIEKLKKTFNEHRSVLNAIEGAIREESSYPYPQYMTEQVISSFFCEKFNTQKDIWILLKFLEGDIVDKNKPLPTQEDYLKGV